jgi:hypothetical protein
LSLLLLILSASVVRPPKILSGSTEVGGPNAPAEGPSKFSAARTGVAAVNIKIRVIVARNRFM